HAQRPDGGLRLGEVPHLRPPHRKADRLPLLPGGAGRRRGGAAGPCGRRGHPGVPPTGRAGEQPTPGGGPLMKKQPGTAVEALTKASKGLQMPSETDAPFAAFAWEDANELTRDRLLRLAHQPKGTAVEESS